MKNAMLISRFIVLLFCCVGFASTANAAHEVFNPINTAVYKQWSHLGSKTVNFRLDRDVIRVGARNGAFQKLKIEVRGGDLKMHRMVVEYRNGQKEVIQLRHHFSARSGSRVIDLNGNRRIIKDITFIYDSVNKPGRKATIHVFGRR